MLVKKRRLERKLDRQRRANNPQNYDEKRRVKKHGKQCLTWKNSKGYLATRQRLAGKEHKLAAHRKSLHRRLVNEIVRVGNDIRIEKISYTGWQKQFGKSVGLRAPGDAHRSPETHGCKYRRNPARVSYAHNQTVPVLSWLQEIRQKAPLPTLA